jgi:hypothetical protein
MGTPKWMDFSLSWIEIQWKKKNNDFHEQLDEKSIDFELIIHRIGLN